MNRDAQNDCSEDNANNEVDVAVMGWVMVVGPLSHGFWEQSRIVLFSSPFQCIF